jgi:hypothetical protein
MSSRTPVRRPLLYIVLLISLRVQRTGLYCSSARLLNIQNRSCVEFQRSVLLQETDWCTFQHSSIFLECSTAAADNVSTMTTAFISGIFRSILSLSWNKKFWGELIACFLSYDTDQIEINLSTNSSSVASVFVGVIIELFPNNDRGYTYRQTERMCEVCRGGPSYLDKHIQPVIIPSLWVAISPQHPVLTYSNSLHVCTYISEVRRVISHIFASCTPKLSSNIRISDPGGKVKENIWNSNTASSLKIELNLL